MDTSFRRYDRPVILIIAQWWQSLSATAEAVTLLPNTSPHLPTGTLVVTMVDRLSA